jgi:hypothetical protein
MSETNRKVTVKNNQELAEQLEAIEVIDITPDEMQPPLQDAADVMDDPANAPTSVEDLPDEELIWPGGPNAGQIKLWKKEYGDVYVTSITYEKHIAWRTLNRLEYKNLMKKMGQLVQAGQLTESEASLWNEEAIAEICILYPAFDKQSLVSEMAGLPSLIAQEVLEASGFQALEVRQL